MKLFWQKAEVQKFEHAKDFAEEYNIGKNDFILASKSTYETYFAPLGLEAHVEFKSKYGKGEPTDVMIDAGSEVSNVSIAEFTKLHTKMGLAVDEIYADRAVLIPELLTGLPYSFFSTSAIDAFIHAIESYVSPKATLYTQMFSMKAMEMIIEGFRKIAEHGEEYRMNLLDDFLTASNLAGIAFGNAGTGAVHAMSYPLSGVYHVTHGEANYQFLTAVFAKYQELDPNGRIKKLNNFLSNILKCKSDEVYTKIEKLLDQIIARKPLHEYGMKEEEIESFAKTVEETQQRLLNQSYVKLTWQQMAEIYKELY